MHQPSAKTNNMKSTYQQMGSADLNSLSSCPKNITNSNRFLESVNFRIAKKIGNIFSAY